MFLLVLRLHLPLVQSLAVLFDFCPHKLCHWLADLLVRKQKNFSPHLHWNYSECRPFHSLKYSWTSTYLFIGVKPDNHWMKTMQRFETGKVPLYGGQVQVVSETTDWPTSCSLRLLCWRWTAGNSLPKRMNSKISSLLQSRFDWLGKFCQWKRCICIYLDFLTDLEMWQTAWISEGSKTLQRM